VFRRRCHNDCNRTGRRPASRHTVRVPHLYIRVSKPLKASAAERASSSMISTVNTESVISPSTAA